MRLSRLALAAVSIALATQTVPNSASAATRGAVPSGIQRAPSRVLPPPRVVDVRSIAKRPSRTGAGQSWLKAPIVRSSARAAGIAASTAGPHAVEMASAFEGLSLAQNEQLYGQDQGVEPADAQIAASPSALVEVAGNTMALFGSDGSLQWTVDIERLFLLPAGYFFYAPSLQYDWGSGRWFLGGIASSTTAHNSWLLMAVSRSGNPFGTWSLITTDARINNPSNCQNPCPNTVYYMRESITVVDDKVVQTEQAQNCLSGCNNVAGTFLVMRKDHLVAGVQPSTNWFTFAYNQTDFLAIPPQSLGGTYGNIAFLAWLKVVSSSPTDLTPNSVGLLQITGLPDPNRVNAFNGSTTVWEKDFNFSLSGYATPSQPGGNLSAAPTPLTSGVYRDGQVVLAINDTCHAAPAPAAPCLHIVKETDFGNATPIMTANGSTGRTVPLPTNSAMDAPIYGFGDTGLFDASLAIDPYGNLFGSAAFSSPTRNPGMAVFGIRAPINLVSWFMPVSPIVEGPSAYHSMACGTGGTDAWGAYMRAVPDPNNWSHVWMPGEVAPDSCSWATAMVSATMGVGPQAARMSPAYGSTKGGQTVEIDGSFFVPNADQVMFGASAGTILDESPTAIVVSAPPGVAGAVSVSVQTPDGASTAGTFTYITPGQLAPPPASTGIHWR